MHILEETMLCW